MRFMLIALPMTILIDVLTFLNFFEYQQEAVYEFEQRQLDLQVNYSVDAAVAQMLSETTHISTDYADWGYMTLDPEVALDTYIAVLLRNLGWSDSEKNRTDLIESSIPFFIVAGYDGYYVYEREVDMFDYDVLDKNGNVAYTTEERGWEFHWTPKIPYAVQDGTTDTAITYFYNMGNDTYGTYNMSTNTIKQDNVLNTSSTAMGHGSYNMAMQVISECLTDACNTALYMGTEGNTDVAFYLPSTYSEWQTTNPVTTPSILTYLNRSDQDTKFNVTTFGIGGSKIDDTDFVVTYEVNDVKYYGWAINRDEITSYYYPNGNNKFITAVYTSAEEAAQQGFKFDYLYYHRE